MNLEKEFIDIILPNFLGFISEALSAEDLSQEFEEKLKKTPTDCDIWSWIFKLWHGILEEETELINTEIFSNGGNPKILRFDSLKQLLQSDESTLKYYHLKWLLEHSGRIAHPDHWSPADGIEHEMFETFNVKFKNRIWNFRYISKIKKEYSHSFSR